MAVAFVFVVPLAWMIAGSLRPTGLPPARGIEWLPWPPAWDNYRRIFEILPLARYAVPMSRMNCVGECVGRGERIALTGWRL